MWLSHAKSLCGRRSDAEDSSSDIQDHWQSDYTYSTRVIDLLHGEFQIKQKQNYHKQSEYPCVLFGTMKVVNPIIKYKSVIGCLLVYVNIFQEHLFRCTCM